MLDKQVVLEAVKAGRESQCLDHRDYSRLIDFFPVEDWKPFGFGLKEGATHEQKNWTEENILAMLERDLAFAFEKALGQRGISASLMFHVVKMWLWVLEDPLQHFSDEGYAQYGLPLLKAVAVKYGFENEIGDDAGNEDKYAV